MYIHQRAIRPVSVPVLLPTSNSRCCYLSAKKMVGMLVGSQLETPPAPLQSRRKKILQNLVRQLKILDSSSRFITILHDVSSVDTIFQLVEAEEE